MLSYNNHMAQDLTHKQERFAQLVAAGLKQSAAYRQSYDVSLDCAPSTIWKRASELAADGKVGGRIAELRLATADQVARERAWTAARLVEEAEANMRLARSGGWRGMSSANGALELIGRVTGLLSGKAPTQVPVITSITMVMHMGANPETGQPQVVETSYRELPLVAEGEDRDIPDPDRS
ncbi:MAG: hypothetical protein EXR54_08215 [Dehalococcoidia bacterium]|nr:hypothetical protein [Dehalococcoidia bacterium]